MTISISDTGPDLRDAIRRRAAELGFDACRFTGVTAPWPAAARLEEFLGAGRQGDMDWMAEPAERRASPQALWPEAVFWCGA